MQPLPSLTRAEAEQRAALIDVTRYDIAVDLTELATGTTFRAVTEVRFSCRSPGAATFIDAAVDVVSATLNGTPLDTAQVTTGRLQLSDLAAENVLVVASAQPDTSSGEWVHRSVDPSDGEVYVWMSFEPDDARRAWACFDQPDLKAPHRFTVDAPASWTVVSNSAGPVVTRLGSDVRRWEFGDTPPLSTYVPVINAGPWYQIRSERGGFDLGLLCRQSLAAFLDRDAEELFQVTAQGLTYFGDRFDLQFPQRTYNQVFVPDMGGAMENYGCVTWSDVFIYRSDPSYSEREQRAAILLHEMAHMWFGDIVTMTWWEDLWLNEAFAEWACYWAAEAATPYRDVWSSFLADYKLTGYAADMAPTTHPIRQPAVDVAAAVASFDGITYPKGASALKQLFALVGEDACVAGLRSYFAKHRWGNTQLADLIGELAAASGRDLAGWTEGWLDTAGTDRLSLDRDSAGNYVLRAAGPGGIPPRPHRLNIGIYGQATDGESLVRHASIAVETEGEATDVPGLAAASQVGAVVVVNDDDLTFASVRPNAESLPVLLESAARLPTAVSRAVAVTTAWDMLVCDDLAAADFVRCATSTLLGETVDGLIEPFLSRAVEAADMWSPAAQRDALMRQVADACLDLADKPSRRQVALRALAQTAVTDEQLARLQRLIGSDVDLRWRSLVRLAELDLADPGEVSRLTEEDPDPDSWLKALAVESARPDPAKKEAAWHAMAEERRIPLGSLGQLRRAFWRRSQDALLEPYAERYLRALPTLDRGGMITSMTLSSALYPRAGVGAEFAENAVAAAGAAAISPAVAKKVIELTDQLRRMLATRGR